MGRRRTGEQQLTVLAERSTRQTPRTAERHRLAEDALWQGLEQVHSPSTLRPWPPRVLAAMPWPLAGGLVPIDLDAQGS